MSYSKYYSELRIICWRAAGGGRAGCCDACGGSEGRELGIVPGGFVSGFEIGTAAWGGAMLFGGFGRFWKSDGWVAPNGGIFILGADVPWFPSKTIDGMGLFSSSPMVAVEVGLMVGVDSCANNIDGVWFPAGLLNSEKVFDAYCLFYWFFF